MPHDEVPALLREHGVLLLTSRYEASPTVVKEALRVTIGEGSFTGWVAEQGEPILANDALNDARGLTIDGTDDIEESMLDLAAESDEGRVGAEREAGRAVGETCELSRYKWL